MPTNVIMPQMGESIAEGTITRWIKKPGDTEWIPDTSYGKFSAIQRGVKCPSGTGEPVMVTPAGMNTALTAKPSDKK